MTEVCEAERNWRGKSSQLIGQQQENKSNLSNRSSGVQISRDICTHFGRYLYSTKCSWIIKTNKGLLQGSRSIKTVNAKFVWANTLNYKNWLLNIRHFTQSSDSQTQVLKKTGMLRAFLRKMYPFLRGEGATCFYSQLKRFLF